MRRHTRRIMTTWRRTTWLFVLMLNACGTSDGHIPAIPRAEPTSLAVRTPSPSPGIERPAAAGTAPPSARPANDHVPPLPTPTLLIPPRGFDMRLASFWEWIPHPATVLSYVRRDAAEVGTRGLWNVQLDQSLPPTRTHTLPDEAWGEQLIGVAIAPSAGTVAYLTGTDATSTLWVLPPQATTARPIAHSVMRSADAMVWSDDGQSLAFVTGWFDPETTTEWRTFWRYQADTQEVREIRRVMAGRLVGWYDATTMVIHGIVDAPGPAHLALLAVADGHATPIVPLPTHEPIRLAPNGRYALTSVDGVGIMIDLIRRQTVRLATDTSLDVRQAVWNPASTAVVIFPRRAADAIAIFSQWGVLLNGGQVLTPPPGVVTLEVRGAWSQGVVVCATQAEDAMPTNPQTWFYDIPRGDWRLLVTDQCVTPAGWQ